MISTLYTIGFTKKKAKQFFELLKANNVRLLIDIRLNNVSQLAAFAKRDDLKYFLSEICDCDYVHKSEWAPTKEILDQYKNKDITWDIYVEKFLPLIESRAIQNHMPLEQLDHACLLCSEPTAEKCHRRLVAEYLKKNLRDQILIKHL